MAIPYEFAYERPETAEQAIKLLGKYGKNARILAGGTDLANQMKQGFRVPEILIDIKNIKEWEVIKMVNNELHIGSLVTFNDLRKSQLIREKLNILFEAAGLVASTGVRNRATMVGNICSAVACMDSAAPLLVHEAVIHTMSIDGERAIPIQQWFIDNRKTAIQDNELVTHVSIPIPEKKYAGAYQKMMRYSGEDLSQSNVGVLVLSDNKYHVAFGSVGPIPKRSLKIENLLNTKGISKETIEEAKAMIETVIAPITDVRATKEYRMHMTKVMFERALKSAVERFKQPKLITQ
ncbi:MAG: xanthine dehydrogenase family protein subunit M [Bacteroidales bacterium]|nr:xanthine dehydrogenase family protein subunit M [Bacteroidales bacterium]